MIEIVTLFMWLATGTQRVDLSVTGPVALVEVHVDGERIGEMKQPPWSFEFDFGAQLRPRELRVIARDGRGHELDRAVRWINLSISTAKAQIEFETDHAGRPRAASLDWESIGVTRPETMELTFDGRNVPIDNPARVVFPPYDESAMHFVAARLSFPGQEAIELSTTFGGRYGDEVATELTAIPLRLGKRARLPDAGQLGNWLTHKDQKVVVHTVEKGEAEVVVVRDPAAQPYFDRVALAHSLGPAGSRRLMQRNPRVNLSKAVHLARKAFTFPEGTHASLVSPFAMPLHKEDLAADTFPSSESLPADREGLFWLSHRSRPRRLPVRLADAVALAGMEAQASGRRRAVILILGGTEDRSHHSVANVREYLRQLRVPLFVWSMESDQPDSEWGEVIYLGGSSDQRGSVNQLRLAVREVAQDLKAQRVVWIRGRLLPQKVKLSDQAAHVTLAGGAS